MLDFESTFIPMALKQFAEAGEPPNQLSRMAFKRFLERVEFSHNLHDKGRLYSEGELDRILANENWPSIISALMYHATGSDPDTQVWGDKTPKYLTNMTLLGEHFPTARFLHIFRDPRDRCLSVQKAWGGHMLISAQQWLESELEASRQLESLGGRGMSFSYESLTSEPRVQVKSICSFLNLDYSDDMLEFDRPLENHGDRNRSTRTQKQVVAGNTGKFLREVPPRQLRRLERIVFPFAKSRGYQPTVPDLTHAPLNRLEKLYCSIPHYYYSARYFVKRWGIIKGLRHALQRWRL